MKNLTTILIICFFFLCSCSGKPKQGKEYSGKIEIENGMGEKIKIPYSVIYDNEAKGLIPSGDLKKIIVEASDKSAYSCKYKPTYEPIKVEVFMRKDTIYATVNFRAKNAYGVPDELRMSSVFKGTNFIESF